MVIIARALHSRPSILVTVDARRMHSQINPRKQMQTGRLLTRTRKNLSPVFRVTALAKKTQTFFSPRFNALQALAALPLKNAARPPPRTRYLFLRSNPLYDTQTNSSRR